MSQLSALSKFLLNSQYTQAELKKDGLPWTLSKGFDTACPVGNFIPAQDLKDPHNVDIWCKVGALTVISINLTTNQTTIRKILKKSIKRVI